VSNSATGNLLEGSRVELPALARSTLTDNTGRYVFAGLPAGSHMIVATYLGLDAVRADVTLTAGQRAVRNFDLTAGIYQMAQFKVTGEREGYAAALTEKRNATNVKDVVAMDQFGNLPNLGTGEVVMRLPGVAGSDARASLDEIGYAATLFKKPVNTQVELVKALLGTDYVPVQMGALPHLRRPGEAKQEEQQRKKKKKRRWPR
jgi:hypothetical protein